MTVNCHSVVNETMQLVIPLSILGASFWGSAHCTAMCGGLVTHCTYDKRSFILYHLGRMISYSALGAVAGGFSELAPRWLALGDKLTTITAIFVGVSLVIIGIKKLKNENTKHTSFLSQIAFTSLRRLNNSKLPNEFLVFITGLFNIFLPCGWLYSFVLGSLAAGSALKGAAFMSLFWLGTLPALTLTSVSLRTIVGKKINDQKVASILYISAGFLTLALRLKDSY